jgi:nitrogen fixation protein FixH
MKTVKTMTDLPLGARPQRRSLWIPWTFVGLMLVVVAVNATLIYYAEHTFSGLDTEKYYQEGVDYNTSLKDAAASAALGWTGKASIDGNGGQHRVRIAIVDQSGAAVSGLKVTLHLVRPVSTAMDQFVDLKPVAPGIYAADVKLPALGVWDLRFEATGGKATWQSTQRLFVK